MHFTSEMTIGEARAELRKLIQDGHSCPVCTQFAKIYKRSINAGMARALIMMYRRGGTDWVNVPDLGLPGGDLIKTRFWELIEAPPDGRREDGSRRTGRWRITSAGEEWVQGRSTVTKYAQVYNDRPLRFEGAQVSIQVALGKRFNYDELMGGATS